MIGKLAITIVFVIIGYTTLGMNNTFAQSSEQNEKLMECFDFKEKVIPNNPNGFLVNCPEYVNSDYETVEEFLQEEHPELKLTE